MSLSTMSTHLLCTSEAGYSNASLAMILKRICKEYKWIWPHISIVTCAMLQLVAIVNGLQSP